MQWKRSQLLFVEPSTSLLDAVTNPSWSISTQVWQDVVFSPMMALVRLHDGFHRGAGPYRFHDEPDKGFKWAVRFAFPWFTVVVSGLGVAYLQYFELGKDILFSISIGAIVIWISAIIWYFSWFLNGLFVCGAIVAVVGWLFDEIDNLPLQVLAQAFSNDASSSSYILVIVFMTVAGGIVDLVEIASDG